MKKRVRNYTSVIVVIVFLISAILILFSDKGKIENVKITTPQDNVANIPDDIEDSGYFNGEKTESHTVRIYPSVSWFYPLVLRIKQGDSATFVNDGSETHWIASNPHVTHDKYPGSDIKKCGTPEEKRIFDSCRGIEPGDSYTFTFYEKGIWKYHDHLRASIGGTIVVN